MATQPPRDAGRLPGRFRPTLARHRADYRPLPQALGVNVVGVDLAAEVLNQCVHPERVPPRSPIGWNSVAKPALVERNGVHEGGEEPPA